MANPLLEVSKLPYAAVPFDRIETDHFVPALDEAIAQAKAALTEIKKNPQPPTFANTIEALEKSTSGVYDIAYIYSNLRHAHGDAVMQGLAKEVMPKLIELESDINLDEILFARVKAVYESQQTSALTAEQQTLVQKVFRSFKRNGSLLDAKSKQKLRAIDEELSTLGPQFSEHVLKVTNEFDLVVTSAEDLAGLPPSTIEAAVQTAIEKGKAGAWVFTLHAPSLLPFLRYADSRELRRKMWLAQNTRAANGPYRNQELVIRIASLRHQRAQLLGYDSHAHFQMEEQMAERPERVREFLKRLLDKSRPVALKEVAELKAFKKAETGDDSLEQWDYHYWATKLKERAFNINTEELRQYFKLEAVLEGAFEHARLLYDLHFKLINSVPVYHSDVSVYEVTKASTGEYMGLFYADFFPRSTKGGGAWCTRFKGQWEEKGHSVRPHVSIVCNFTKPTATKPSLLTTQEVLTLFHEFGHALHSLLSRCTYRSLSCTNVFRDFVELPSQIMENWIKEEEGLKLFARHYQTGEVLPGELVEKLRDSENFHAAFLMLRQLRFGLLDLAWYSKDAADVTDMLAFERQATAETELLPVVDDAVISCSFEHIFSGGYSAGYYGYKWAEVLDADAFEYFKEKGLFSKEVADRFRVNILEKGGSEHPMKLYKAFRGREPDPEALLRRSQLI